MTIAPESDVREVRSLLAEQCFLDCRRERQAEREWGGEWIVSIPGETTFGLAAARVPLPDWARLGPTVADLLAEVVEFRNYPQVRAFLHKNPTLVHVVFEAFARLPDYFGDRSRMALEVAFDPAEETEGELFALVAVELPIDDALARLRDMDRTWWLEASSRAGGLVNVDLDYGAWPSIGETTSD